MCSEQAVPSSSAESGASSSASVSEVWMEDPVPPIAGLCTHLNPKDLGGGRSPDVTSTFDMSALNFFQRFFGDTNDFFSVYQSKLDGVTDIVSGKWNARYGIDLAGAHLLVVIFAAMDRTAHSTFSIPQTLLLREIL